MLFCVVLGVNYSGCDTSSDRLKYLFCFVVVHRYNLIYHHKLFTVKVKLGVPQYRRTPPGGGKVTFVGLQRFSESSLAQRNIKAHLDQH